MARALRACLNGLPARTFDAAAAQQARNCQVAAWSAAVLIPLIARAEGISVLFTLRSTALAHHAGQVSFPGGRVETTDSDYLCAALRELNEEVASIRTSCTLQAHSTPTAPEPDSRSCPSSA
ncbi:MAG: NUDIX hydrolase [Chromatiales bacterium]